MVELIRFTDGILVEVTHNTNRAEPVAGMSAERMVQAFDTAGQMIALVSFDQGGPNGYSRDRIPGESRS